MSSWRFLRWNLIISFPALEILHDFLRELRLDEEDGPVARLQDGRAVRDHGLPVAHVSADEAGARQLGLHQRLARDGRALLHDDLDGLGLGALEQRDRDDAAAARKGQHLARREQAGRENDVDADLLHELHVLIARDTHDRLCLVVRHVAREQRQHEIELVILRQADDDVRLGHALLGQEVDVRAVAADGDAVDELVRHEAAAVRVLVDDLDAHALFLEHRRECAARTARADDDDAVQLAGIALHESLAELLDLLRNADEVGIVVWQQAVVAVRDDHAVVAEDHAGQHALRELDVLERDVCQRRRAAHLRLKQPDLAVREVLDVEGRRRHEDAVDLVRRDELRVEHEVDVEVLLEVVPRLAHELHVADTGDRMADAVLLREDTGDHVDLIAGRHGDEDVGPADVGVVHRDGARAVGEDGQHVERVLDRLQLAFIVIDDDHIELFF